MAGENDEAVTREKTRDQVNLIGLQHLHRAADFTTTTSLQHQAKEDLEDRLI